MPNILLHRGIKKTKKGGRVALLKSHPEKNKRSFKKVMNKNELNITVNNGIILGVELDNEGQKIIITEKDNNKTAKTEITAADFITMLNWYTYQKQIGNKNLMF